MLYITLYFKTNVIQEIFASTFPDKFGNKDVTNNCWFTLGFFNHYNYSLSLM